MRVVVYTVLLEGYDYLFPVPSAAVAESHPPKSTTQIEWVLFSDKKPLFSKDWVWRPLPSEVLGSTATERNRYCKFFAQRLFPDHDYSIYIDANVALKRPIVEEIEEFISSGADIGLGYVNGRQTIQEEAAFCRSSSRFDAKTCDVLDTQVANYEAAGLPAEHRLFQGRVIFRNHGSDKLKEAMQAWWGEFLRWARRDQFSLPFVIHRHKLDVHTWHWDHRKGDSFFHVARHKPKRAWMRPEAFVEEMRFSRPIWMTAYNLLKPFFYLRLLVRRYKYEKHRPIFRRRKQGQRGLK